MPLDYTLPEADDRLTSTLRISLKLQSQLLMQGVFLGSAKDLRHLLRPLLRADSPQNVTIKEIPWLEAVDLIAVTLPLTPIPFKSVGLFLYNLLPDKGIATIRSFIDESPASTVTSVFFHGAGGAIDRVPNDATAYFYRKALSSMSSWVTWSTPDGADPGIRWVEDFRRAMLPFTRGVYVNTPDLSIKVWSKAYYGGNFKRLTKVKAKYDPENVFHLVYPPPFTDEGLYYQHVKTIYPLSFQLNSIPIRNHAIGCYFNNLSKESPDFTNRLCNENPGFCPDTGICVPFTGTCG